MFVQKPWHAEQLAKHAFNLYCWSGLPNDLSDLTQHMMAACRRVMDTLSQDEQDAVRIYHTTHNNLTNTQKAACRKAWWLWAMERGIADTMTEEQLAIELEYAAALDRKYAALRKQKKG